MSETNMLLLEIQAVIGCPYLSDLHSYCRLYNAQMEKQIMEIPPERYSLRTWKEAVSYITGNSCSAASIQEAKERLFYRVY